MFQVSGFKFISLRYISRLKLRVKFQVSSFKFQVEESAFMWRSLKSVNVRGVKVIVS